MALFVIVELKQERPMFGLLLFRQPAVGVSFATFAIGAGMFTMFPYLSIYFQDVIGTTPAYQSGKSVRGAELAAWRWPWPGRAQRF